MGRGLGRGRGFAGMATCSLLSQVVVHWCYPNGPHLPHMPFAALNVAREKDETHKVKLNGLSGFL